MHEEYVDCYTQDRSTKDDEYQYSRQAGPADLANNEWD